MKRFLTVGSVVVLSVALAGCANTDMNKQSIGVIAGGAIGGLVGGYFGHGSGKALAAVGGALAGAVIGGVIGHNMDQVDQARMQKALEDNRTGQVTRWRNPNNGNTYAFKPTRTYYHHGRDNSQGTPCREYSMTASIGGKPEQVYGTACRQADGSWKIEK